MKTKFACWACRKNGNGLSEHGLKPNGRSAISDETGGTARTKAREGASTPIVDKPTVRAGTDQARFSAGAPGRATRRRAKCHVGAHSASRKSPRGSSGEATAVGGTNKAMRSASEGSAGGGRQVFTCVTDEIDPLSTTLHPKCPQLSSPPGISLQHADRSESTCTSSKPAAARAQCCVPTSQAAARASARRMRNRCTAKTQTEKEQLSITAGIRQNLTRDFAHVAEVAFPDRRRRSAQAFCRPAVHVGAIGVVVRRPPRRSGKIPQNFFHRFQARICQT